MPEVQAKNFAISQIIQNVKTLAMCWQIKMRNGNTLCFTDHDANIVINGSSYLANSAINSSAIASSSTMIPDSLDIESIIDNEIIKEKDILSGEYDHAEVTTFFTDYSNPTEKFQIKRGWLGEVRINKGIFFVEVKGLLQSMEKCLGSLYSINCRANFGDSKCKVDTKLYRYKNKVDKTYSKRSFSLLNNIPKDILFNCGKVIFMSGKNKGISMEINNFSDKKIQLILDMPLEIQEGDSIEIFPGCDKNFKTCCEIYNNSMNFRGEPHIPASNSLIKL